MDNSEKPTMDAAPESIKLESTERKVKRVAPKSNGKKSKKLMDCPVCEWSISKHAHFCPNCGEPDPSNRLLIGNWVSRIFWTIVIVAAVYYGYTVLWPMIMDMIKNL